MKTNHSRDVAYQIWNFPRSIGLSCDYMLEEYSEERVENNLNCEIFYMVFYSLIISSICCLESPSCSEVWLTWSYSSLKSSIVGP